MGIIWGKEWLFLVGGRSSREPVALVGPGLEEEPAVALFKLCRPPAKEVVLELQACQVWWEHSLGSYSRNSLP